MRLDAAAEDEIRDLVSRLDGLVPRDDAHLMIPASPEGNASLGNRAGYLRFGLEFLRAALDPLPASDDAPPRIEPDLQYLLADESSPPFDLCEIDEAVASRPPVQSRLGALGQLGAGVLLTLVLILAFVGAAVVWRWVFG